MELALLPEPRPKARTLSTRYGARDDEPRRTGFDVRASFRWCEKALNGADGSEAAMSKSSDKPKKQQKQGPQKTLKERRSEKRSAKKLGSGALLAGDK